MPWRPWALKRIPAHWAAISPRTSGRRERVRDATDPFNAILNYCYTLLEVETRIACEAVGLDPDLGLLHVDDRLRESFIYDLLEPLRSKADVWALELLHKEKLHPAMFHELRDGIVRLDPDLTELLASALMPRFARRRWSSQTTTPSSCDGSRCRGSSSAKHRSRSQRGVSVGSLRVRLLQGAAAA